MGARGGVITPCRSSAFQRQSRLAKCSRNLHIIAQTVTLAQERYPIGGRYLGVDPGPRLRYRSDGEHRSFASRVYLPAKR
jgi:hypothetical protein